MLRRACAAVALAVGAMAASCGSSEDDAAGRAATSTPAPAATATATPEATATPSATPAARPAQVRRGVGRRQVGSFTSPVYVTAPPRDTGRLFVVEQGGRIRIVRGGRTLPRPFLDIRGLVTVGSEQGLLSMAFAPDYASSGRFYVYYTDTAGEQRIVEYRRRGPDRANPDSARLVMRMADPESNHNGGLLLFGPDDLLYIGTGDGGGGGDQHGTIGNAQDLASPLGKLLRINPRARRGRPYTVPRSNPFVGRSGARPEIYAYGLRNPWRFSFDRRTGDLTIGDVGQGAWEEINFLPRGRGRGANFGWRPYEGRSRYTGEPAPNRVRPAIVRSHENGYCSITGGVVVRDRRLAGLRGRYLFADFCRGVIEAAVLRAGRDSPGRDTRLSVTNPSSFGEDARGRVYVVSLDGPVYRLVPR